MARRKPQDSACIFCETDPCSCNSPAKPKPRLKVTRKVETVKLPDVEPKPSTQLDTLRKKAHGTDDEMHTALRNLAVVFPEMYPLEQSTDVGDKTQSYLQLLTWKAKLRGNNSHLPKG